MNVRLSALVLLFSSLANVGLAQTLWTAGTGDWFTGSNWSLGVPNSASPPQDARIANGGTAQVLASGASVRQLRVGTSAGDGSLLVDGGTLTVTDDLHVNEGGFASSMTVRNGGTVTAPDTVIGHSGGFTSSFTLRGAGTTYNATTSFIAGQAPTGVGSTVTVDQGAVLASGTTALGTGGLFGATVDGAGTRWSSTGAFTVGTAGNGTLLITNGATVHVGTALSINAMSNVQLNGGALRFNTISGLSQLSYGSGTIQLAGNRDFAVDTVIPALFGNPAVIPAGKELVVEGATTIRQNRLLTVSGGRFVSAGQLAIGQPGGGFGTMIVNSGGFAAVSSAVVDAGGAAIVNGVGSRFEVGGNLQVAPTGSGFLRSEDGGSVYVGGALSLGSSAQLQLTGGSLRFDGYSRVTPTALFVYTAGTVQVAGNRTIGSDAALVDFFGAAPNIPAGKALVVEGMAMLTPSSPVTLSGGGFSADTILMTPGSRLSAAAASQASGAMLALAGSTIDAGAGDFTLGDATRVDGFYGNGRLLTGERTVTLADANDAALDSAALVTLGAGGNPGTLVAANGLTLDFGGNVTGFGAVDTPDDVFRPLVNNGHFTGASVTQPLSLPGYVKGVGTFDNVEFSGTFAPGFSPALTTVGSIVMTPTNTLIMELGGTNRGGQYDAILASGNLGLGGTLNVTLIDGFTPAAGNSFDLFDWSTQSGTFSSLSLPALGAGLVWNTSQLYTTGVLSVTPGFLAADFDEDGDVDGDDLTRWRNNFDAGTTHMTGDADADADADGADFLTWQRQLGLTSAAPTATTVPEPSAAVLLALAIASTARRRRRAAD